MTESTEEQPVVVPATANRTGEILRRWWWVEPTIWTERMLTALDQGVKGGHWFSLIHHRWPNAFFANQGLYNLGAAHALVRQSSTR